MVLFQKKIGLVFLKEESDATNFIIRMQELGIYYALIKRASTQKSIWDVGVYRRQI